MINSTANELLGQKNIGSIRIILNILIIVHFMKILQDTIYNNIKTVKFLVLFVKLQIS